MTELDVKKDFNKAVGKVVNLVTSTVSQTSSEKSDKTFSPAEGLDEVLRRAGAESMVLLKNNGKILPLSEENTVSVFGRVQYDTFFVGYGSGGDVNAHYKVSFADGLKKCDRIHLNTELCDVYRKWIKANPVDNGYWGHWPMSYDEMPVSDALAKRAAAVSDTALVFLGRAAGEDRENRLEKGSYYLTDEEEKMLSAVSRYFTRWAVVLNIGGIFDFSWMQKYNVPCALLCWQGGMEAGNALADVLCGKVSPSGKLTDTVAKAYDRLPTARNFGGKNKNHYEEDIYVGYRYFETFDKDGVLFPFGFGITYAEHSVNVISSEKTSTNYRVSAVVKNTGNANAKNVLQIYVSAADTDLDMPERILCGFEKTKELMPGEEQTITFVIPPERLAAYDDGGKTGFRSAYVLQKGKYTFHLGFDSRETIPAGQFTVTENTLLEQLSEACAPRWDEHLMRLKKLNNNGHIAKTFEPAPERTVDLRQRILDELPPLLHNRIPDCTFNDVREGKASLEEFAASLSAAELEALTRGDYIMNSPLGAKGNAGVFGGVLESLRDKGIPPLTCTDGPSGIRLAANTALLPNGTALASTWNPALTEEVYSFVANEMKERGSDVLLAPGMNIHRDPLCGRNFEYYSEDPLLTGKIAAAVVNGLQKNGVSACPKHFACNNQETNRTHNDSVVSERALREIYLKGFEICVKEAKPKNIMTSYNKINGVWSHYNYELVTDILRGEWGYEGCVMTDWWMRSSRSPEFPKIQDQAYRVRAGVDVLMPGGGRSGKRKPDGTLMRTLCEDGGITLNEIQRCAVHVLRFALTKAPDKNDDENKVTEKEAKAENKKQKKTKKRRKRYEDYEF